MFYQYLFESLRKQQLRGVLLNIYAFNLVNFTKSCSLLATFTNTQETFQRDLNVVVRIIWRHDVRQCQINVETVLRYVNVEIYNVEQHEINVVYFNVDVNVRQRWNNAVIFNVEFHNVDQCGNNVVNMTIFKKLKRAKNYFWA